jgi:hypothetical protein
MFATQKIGLIRDCEQLRRAIALDMPTRMQRLWRQSLGRSSKNRQRAKANWLWVPVRIGWASGSPGPSGGGRGCSRRQGSRPLPGGLLRARRRLCCGPAIAWFPRARRCRAAGSAGDMPWARATSDYRALAASWRTHSALKADVCFSRVVGRPPEFVFSIMSSGS